MSEQHDRGEDGGDDEAICAKRPGEGQAKRGEAKRQIVVHEAHVEDVAVAQHGDERREEPRRLAADRFQEGEDSPKENKDANRDDDFFGGDETEGFGGVEEQEVEEDVVPLPDDVNAGGSSLLDKFGEPGIVDVAAEIAGFDVAVPEARNDEENGN